MTRQIKLISSCRTSVLLCSLQPAPPAVRIVSWFGRFSLKLTCSSTESRKQDILDNVPYRDNTLSLLKNFLFKIGEFFYNGINSKHMKQNFSYNFDFNNFSCFICIICRVEQGGVVWYIPLCYVIFPLPPSSSISSQLR